VLKDEKLKKQHPSQKSLMKSSQASNVSLTQATPLKQSSYKLEEKLPLLKQLEKNSVLYLSSNKGTYISQASR